MVLLKPHGLYDPAGAMEVYHGTRPLLRVYRGAGCHREGYWLAPGQTEAGGGQGVDPVLLYALQTHEKQRGPWLEPTGTCPGKVGAVQGLLQAGRGDGKRDPAAVGAVPRAGGRGKTLADGCADERLRRPGGPGADRRRAGSQ